MYVEFDICNCVSCVMPVLWILYNIYCGTQMQNLLSKWIEVDFINLSFEATGFVNVLDVPSKPRLLKPDEVRTVRKKLEGWGKQKRRTSSENNLERWRNEEKPKRFEPSMWSCRGTLLRMTEAPRSSNICSGSKVLSTSFDNNQSWTGWWTWTVTSGSLPARFFC